MSEMLEKVARADAQFCNRDFDGFSKADKRRYMERAAVMVEALREPDGKMFVAADEALVPVFDALACWQAMIDSILSTPTTRGEVK